MKFRTTIPVLLACCGLALTGCAGVHGVKFGEGIHLKDEARNAKASGAKEAYEKVNLLKLIKTQSTNLDALLAEEIKVVQANHQARLDLAFLSMADDRTALGMSSAWKMRGRRLKDLGFPEGVKQARIHLSDYVLIDSQKQRLEDRSKFIFQKIGTRPEPCTKDLPEVLQVAGDVPELKKTLAQEDYEQYKINCREILKEVLEEREKSLSSGEITITHKELKDAQDAVDELDGKIDSHSKTVRDAKKAYQDAVKAVNADGTSENLEKLRNAANALKGAIAGVTDLGEALGISAIPEERIGALNTILAAVASGEAGTAKIDDPQLAAAATVAATIPTLAADIKALQAGLAAPSVADLLIEMRHQALLVDYARKRQTIAAQRVVLHESKLDALDLEVQQWMDFHDRICNFAAAKADLMQPGKKCDSFQVSVIADPDDPDEKIVLCGFEGESPLTDCALNDPWKEHLNNASGAAKREIYAAVAAFSQAMRARAVQDEFDYRVIDLHHRESLAASESAIRDWDNLISAPLAQLAAYYASGIEPTEIADVIFKALGLIELGIIAGKVD